MPSGLSSNTDSSGKDACSLHHCRFSSGGEGGIRTLDTVLPVYHISSVVLSAAQPPLLAFAVYGGVMVRGRVILQLQDPHADGIDIHVVHCDHLHPGVMQRE